MRSKGINKRKTSSDQVEWCCIVPPVNNWEKFLNIAFDFNYSAFELRKCKRKKNKFTSFNCTKYAFTQVQLKTHQLALLVIQLNHSTWLLVYSSAEFLRQFNSMNFPYHFTPFILNCGKSPHRVVRCGNFSAARNKQP